MSNLSGFIKWFQASGGSIDIGSMGFVDFPPSEGGRGAVALNDIPEGHTLFTIPRSLTLSTRTSTLPKVFGLSEWKERKLHEGWVGLILCMMWEAANTSSSKWGPYLDTLPTEFSTPMFWPEDDLKALEGSSVVEKLGRDDAERDYYQKLIPAVESRPNLFLPDHISVYYSLEVYHVMGSRILSRSFDVERWELDDSGEDAPTDQPDGAMDVDLPGPVNAQGVDHTEGGSEGGDGSDEEDASDTSMVPMADMLNARYQTENAKLFYEEKVLRMVSTKPIKAGEQIWNTYGDLPNAELLRRYGHVDLLPLGSGIDGNPGDVLELRADLTISAASSLDPTISPESSKERIEWWLEEGGDDVFALERESPLPDVLISFIHLISLGEDGWSKVQSKGKPPKPKIDALVLSIAIRSLEQKMKTYPTSLKQDEETLETSLSLNKRNALIVVMGEKRILRDVLADCRSQLQALERKEAGQSKRRAEESDKGGAQAKKSRR
ncbi:SET domain-containing protein [Pluteus cervinus]|uniref:SET domain-containing protein n=1 Tax=Pluteus cervinus TaxID=181527 RepID=A0ACD3AL99_9AGAR|nr:SET domain-containing protein [Pluteus cervinus]